jgi:hypothetical protein
MPGKSFDVSVLIFDFGKLPSESMPLVVLKIDRLTLATPNASLVRTYASSLPCADGGGDGLRLSPAL